MPTRPLVTSYKQDMRLFPDLWHKLGLVVWTALLLVFPLAFDDHWVTIANNCAIAVVGATALMILTGFAGQISLGHAAFLALGAYTTAVLGGQYDVPFWLGIPAGGVVAAVVGLMVGPFALRLRGLYLAIVTVGLVFLVNHVLLHMPDITGGPTGIEVSSRYWFGGAGAAETDLPVLDNFTSRNPLELGPLYFNFGQLLYYFFLVFALATVMLAKNLQRSTTGRAMMAVRDQDIAAAVLGVHPARVKIIAFGVSSFLAGVAGGMLAVQQTYLSIENFNLHMSIEYIAMIVLGGIGTVFGAVAGGIAFVILDPIGQFVTEFLPFMAEWSDNQRATVLFAGVVCGFLIFEPLGLFGIWLRIKRYFAGWPFRY